MYPYRLVFTKRFNDGHPLAGITVTDSVGLAKRSDAQSYVDGYIANSGRNGWTLVCYHVLDC